MAVALVPMALALLWAEGGVAQLPATVTTSVPAPAAEEADGPPPAKAEASSAPVAVPLPAVPAGEPAPPREVELAPVALLVDLNSGRVLYARDAAKPFLPASVTKTMTAYVAFELMASGKLNPAKMITESPQTYKEWHRKGSRMFLEPTKPVSVDELVTGIMNVSANDGAVVLAEGVAGSREKWVAMMNDAAHRLGMNDSHYGTPNGWMDNGNTHVSARDLVKLADAMITRYPDYYHRYVGRPGMTYNGITQPNHDPILGVVPGADGIKTGFTNEARYTFLGSAQRGDRRLVMVLAGVNRPHDRAKVAKALMEWGFTAWADQPIFKQGALVGDARVQGGNVSQVGLVAPHALMATLPKGTQAPVSMKITYKGPLMAPILKGDQVAELEVKIGDKAPSHVPLMAAADVAKGGAIDRLRAGFARLVS